MEIPYARQPIELAVSDRVIADTLIRQRVRFLSLLHQQDAEGVSSVKIMVQVTMYAADGEGFGPVLTGPGFAVRQEELGAANDTLVDAQTGATLAVREGRNEADWQALKDTFGQATMLQGDFFEYLRDNGLPGTIRQMIEHHIQQADALGRFA